MRSIVGLSLVTVLACGGERPAPKAPGSSELDMTAPSVASASDARIAVGDNFSCAVTPSRGVVCWGKNEVGQLGNGQRSAVEARPVKVSNVADVIAVGAGTHHACALDSRGAVSCWGEIEPARDGTSAVHTAPIRVADGGVRELSVGGRHTCVLDASGIRCFGWGTAGQLGSGSAKPLENLTPVAGLRAAPFAVSAGTSHTCAAIAGGFVQCWGSGRYGTLGHGPSQVNAMSLSPVDIAGWVGSAIAVSAGGDRTCALLRDGRVRCWGRIRPGRELAEEMATQVSATPVDVPGLARVRAIATGRAHSCAIVDGGTVKCWGWNEKGQLGDGTQIDHNDPVRVSGLDNIVGIDAGELHSCAMRRDGQAFCWGAGRMGQLGDGRSEDSALPVRVATLPAER